MKTDSKKYRVFDLETTGLSVTKDKIITIGCLKKKPGQIIQAKVFYSNPIQENKKKNAAQLVDTTKEKKVIQKFINFMSDTGGPIYTYNGDSFDWPFLHSRVYELFNDYGDTVDQMYKWKEEHGHDLLKSHGLYPSGKSKKLEHVLNEHGISHSEEISGKDVPRYFKNGWMDTLIKYSYEDAIKTAALVEEVNGGTKENVLNQTQ